MKISSDRITTLEAAIAEFLDCEPDIQFVRLDGGENKLAVAFANLRLAGEKRE